MNTSVIKRTLAKGVTKNPWLVILFALLLIASSIPLVTHYAHTADSKAVCDGGTWKNLKWKSDSPNITDGKYVGPSGFAEVEFEWEAKKEAKAGDKFEFDLPDQLKGVDTGTVFLQDHKGEIVATGQWDNEKKKFIITLTAFQERNFDVHGKAHVAVTWNTSSAFDSNLNFSGCGNGSLPGKFEKRDGGEFHDDSKIGEYRGFDNKNKVHTIQWSVGIDPKKHKNEDTGRKVTVTDTAPEGWKFACDGKYTDGYAPVYVSSFIKNSQGKVESVRHAIYPANGYPVGGGTRNGVTGVTQDEGFNTQQIKHNYTLTCTEKHVSVEFPYGLSEEAAPVLTLTAYTDQRPAPGSIVTNKAMIDSKEVQGHVRFPSAGGLGFGAKGGFTVEKNVVGTEEDKKQGYKFDYECKNPQGEVKKNGSVTVMHDSFMHIQDLDKGWKCTITEKISDEVKKGRKLTVSWIAVKPGEKIESAGSASRIEFTVDEKFIEAIHVVVTNKFEEPTGSFALGKIALVTDNAKAEEFRNAVKDKKFKLNYVCTPPNVDGQQAEKKQGTVELSPGQFSPRVSGLPIGTQCTVTEDKTDLNVEGYSYEKLEWEQNNEAGNSKTPDNNGYTFTITKADFNGLFGAYNTYKPVEPNPEPEKGKFKVTKTTTLIHEDNTASFDEKLSAHEFKFTWECTPPEGQGDKQTGDFMVKHKGEFESQEFPVGTSCTVTETEESAKVNGFTHELRVDGEKVKQEGNRFSFTIGSETLLTIQARNEYTPVKKPGPELGQFTLVKEVKDADARAQLKGKKFTFEWECITDDGEPSKTGRVELGNGQGSLISGLPLNSSCTIKETNFEKLDGYTHTLKWLINGEPKSEDPIKVTPRKQSDNPLIVTAINKYTPEEKPQPETGGFTLKKQVEGFTDKNKEFEFSWVCRGDHGTEPVRGTAKLKDGAMIKVENLPIDSTCEVAETNASVDGYEHVLRWLASNGRESIDDTILVDPRSVNKPELVVTAVNKYTPVVPPVPPTTETTTTTEPAPTTSSSTPTTEPTPTTETTTTTQPAPTTSSSTPTTEPAPTTEPTTEPVPTTSSSTPTTQPAPTTTSTTKPVPTTSSSTPTSTSSTSTPITTTSTTTTTTTEPINPTTTHRIPPIVPIPIPIPIPPAPQPPMPVPSVTATTPQVAPPTTQSLVTPKPGTDKPGKGLANTGASVIWLAFVAVLLAAVGGFITYRGRNAKNS
ncbi:DUF5979 domain-containing protein [Corynebacterium kutscheri]|uniref:LPxTG domain-containing protein n=1 Tax=Corynebacterium kutscheri TaxID=35755 RepID=A0AB38VX49_9CORY|nr:DUF5979 domain-containing protein [Corynebacterium kutscheri]VEH06621.1 LPxTG domain-containing protein [Corynebacterium kutscheri]